MATNKYKHLFLLVNLHQLLGRYQVGNWLPVGYRVTKRLAKCTGRRVRFFDSVNDVNTVNRVNGILFLFSVGSQKSCPEYRSELLNPYIASHFIFLCIPCLPWLKYSYISLLCVLFDLCVKDSYITLSELIRCIRGGFHLTVNGGG